MLHSFTLPSCAVCSPLLHLFFFPLVCCPTTLIPCIFQHSHCWLGSSDMHHHPCLCQPLQACLPVFGPASCRYHPSSQVLAALKSSHQLATHTNRNWYQNRRFNHQLEIFDFAVGWSCQQFDAIPHNFCNFISHVPFNITCAISYHMCCFCRRQGWLESRFCQAAGTTGEEAEVGQSCCSLLAPQWWDANTF
jgi:hypothetical protein